MRSPDPGALVAGPERLPSPRAIGPSVRKGCDVGAALRAAWEGWLDMGGPHGNHVPRIPRHDPDAANVPGGPERVAMLSAVIVGSNGPSAVTRKLAFAERDSNAFADGISTQSLVPRTSLTIMSRPSNAYDINAAIIDQVRTCSASDYLITYFAGHGIIENDDEARPALFLACDTTRLDRVPETAVKLTGVVEAYERAAAATAIVMLDCCFSGNSERSLVGVNYFRRMQTGRDLIPTPVIPRGTGRMVLAASGQHQPATEDPGLQHGIFTFALLTVLRRAPGERSVSVARAYADLQREVVQLSHGSQCPSLYGADHGAHLPTFKSPASDG
jgi:hypothetical protein